MDDLRLVRDLFAERPPPSPEVAAAARARMLAPRRPLGRARILARRRPRGGVGRRAWLLTGVPLAAAAAVITALAVPRTAVPPGARPGVYLLPVGARAGADPGGPGRGVLLTAAQTVARTGGPAVPPPGARYWVTRSQVGNFLRVGPGRHPYVILDKASDQRWYARAPQRPSPDLVQNLGVQFASATDATAWRRDGSPASWPVGQDTGLAQPTGAADGSNRRIAAGRGQLTLGAVFSGPAPFSFGGGPLLSAAGLRALPADPSRLRDLIGRGWNRYEGVNREEYLFEVTPALLTLPVTPAVRAALYRMLAGLPGVKSLGPVTDAGGRAGVAVALAGRYSGCGQESVLHRDGGTEEHPAFASCTVEQRVVIDPASGLPLAQELRYTGLPGGQRWSAPDGLFSYQLFQASGWTGASPPES